MPESSRLLTESEYRYIINNLGSGGSSSPVSAEAIIVTIPTTGWSDTFPYTITLPADGAVDSNSPIFYLYTTGETATDEELAGVKLITDMSTTANYVHITASKVPTSSFKIALYGLASGTEVEGDLSEKYNILSGKVNNLETLVSGLEEVDNELNDAISEVAELANEASTIAKGRNRARVFATTEDMNAWLSDSANVGQAIVGDNLYIVELEVPDWWISEVLTEIDSETGFYYKIARLETQKVDLTTIESDMAALKTKDAELVANISSLQLQVNGIIARLGDLSFASVSSLPSTTDPNTIYFTDN